MQRAETTRRFACPWPTLANLLHHPFCVMLLSIGVMSSDTACSEGVWLSQVCEAGLWELTPPHAVQEGEEDHAMARGPDHMTDAPAALKTARRPGQSGEETEHRAGPNPRSGHPTGPHPPYEPNDRQGMAAEKHHSESTSEPITRAEDKPSPSGTVRVVDLSKKPK